jgi:hypothetical protein
MPKAVAPLTDKVHWCVFNGCGYPACAGIATTRDAAILNFKDKMPPAYSWEEMESTGYSVRSFRFVEATS